MQTEKEKTVASPCVDNCCLNEDDVCMGCFRSLQEILVWGAASSSRRLEILDRVAERKRGECSSKIQVPSSKFEIKYNPNRGSEASRGFYCYLDLGTF